MTAGKQSCQQSSPVSYLQTPCSWLLYCCPGYSLIPAATCLRPDSSSRPRCQWRWHVLSTHRARGAQTRCTRVTAYRAATPWHHYSYTHRLRGTKGCQGTVGFEHQSSWILGPWSIGSISSGSAGNEEDPGWIPESGRSPGEGNGNPLQYSCLENAMDRGAWWATVHGVAESQIRLSDLHSDTCLPSDVTCPAQGPVITHLGLTFPSSSSHTTTWHSAWPAELFWHWLYRISCSRLEITHPLQVLTSWPDSQVPPGLCEPYLSPPPHALYASAKLDSLFLWCILVLAPLCLFALPPLKKRPFNLSMKNTTHFLRISSNLTPYMKLSWIPHHSEMVPYFSGLSAFRISEPLEGPLACALGSWAGVHSSGTPSVLPGAAAQQILEAINPFSVFKIFYEFSHLIQLFL